MVNIKVEVKRIKTIKLEVKRIKTIKLEVKRIKTEIKIDEGKKEKKKPAALTLTDTSHDVSKIVH